MTSNLNLLMNKNMCSSRFKSLNLNLVDMIPPLMEKIMCMTLNSVFSCTKLCASLHLTFLILFMHQNMCTFILIFSFFLLWNYLHHLANGSGNSIGLSVHKRCVRKCASKIFCVTPDGFS